MDLLGQLFALRSRAKAYGDTERNRLLQAAGLDAEGLYRKQLLIDSQQQAADIAAQRDRNAAALKPLLSRFGAETAGQVGPLLASNDPQLQARGAEVLGGLMAQIPGMDRISKFQQAQLDQNKQQFNQSLELDRVRTNAAEAASLAARAGAHNSDQLAGLKYLSTDYQANMKAPVEVADAVQQIGNGLKTGNSLGSLAAVIKLAKILDPTSVVREGEVTTVQGGIGTASALINEFNRLGGKGMTPEAAKQFQDVVRQIAGPILQRGLRLGGEYRSSAGKLGVPPDLVTTGVGFPEGYVTRYLQGFPDPEQETTY